MSPLLSSTRATRRGYLYDTPIVSARRVRRQIGIAMIVAALVLAVIAGWAVLHVVMWIAQAMGSGIAPRMAPGGGLRQVMMSLPLA